VSIPVLGIRIAIEPRKLVGMARENFPALPAMPHPLVKLPAATLQNLIAKAKFAISMEESREQAPNCTARVREWLIAVQVTKVRV
jgi:hypothetical protein